MLQKGEPMSDDTISRQAAIDAIEEMQIPIMRSIFPEEQFVFKGMSEALSAIKELPSAQPEIIHCRDCKYYTPVTARCEVRGKGLYLIRNMEDFCSRAERRNNEIYITNHHSADNPISHRMRQD